MYAKNWWGAVGAIPLFTGLMGWCPFYPLLGMSTKK
ncbi:YgaP family membrane protein [Thiolapillus sp.]